MSFFVTANTPLLCPLCRRSNLDYSKDDLSQSWKFFCPTCRVETNLSLSEVAMSYKESRFADLLRERLAAALGRANKIEPNIQVDGVKLQLAPGQAPSPLARKKRDPPKLGRIEVPPYEEEEPELPKLWDRKKNPNKRVQQRTLIRQALQRAQRTIVEDDDE